MISSKRWPAHNVRSWIVISATVVALLLAAHVNERMRYPLLALLVAGLPWLAFGVTRLLDRRVRWHSEDVVLHQALRLTVMVPVLCVGIAIAAWLYGLRDGITDSAVRRTLDLGLWLGVVSYGAATPVVAAFALRLRYAHRRRR